MNVLSIENWKFPYTGNDEIERISEQAEFLIDGKPLSEIFEIEKDRPWFGSTFLEGAGDVLNKEIQAFLGNEAPQNQFGDDRFALYRCHCGSDYCGVISCKIVRGDDDCIYWKDVRYQYDTDEFEEPRISEAKFKLLEYTEAVLNAKNNT